MLCKYLDYLVTIQNISLHTTGEKIHLTTWKKVNEFIYFFLRVKKLQDHEHCYYQVVNKPSQYDTVSCAPSPFLYFETQSHTTSLDCSSLCGWEWPCILAARSAHTRCVDYRCAPPRVVIMPRSPRFCAVLEIETRVSCVLVKHSADWATCLPCHVCIFALIPRILMSS